LTNTLLLASAGAGKSELIAQNALKTAASGKKVLLLTYTINNQTELVKHLCRLHRVQPINIVVKGWFSFLLEDMIRPYQRCIVPERVSGICFNASNPHLNGKFHIPGRREEVDGAYNPFHFVTKRDNAAHTTFLSKLAARIHKETDRMPARRLARIYDAIYIDEVQDLVGWDFEVIRAMVSAKIGTLACVGDFRQTIYRTSVATKKPQTNIEKLALFQRMGFIVEHLNISWRSIQSICNVADRIHVNDGHYVPTISKIECIPIEFSNHCGVFAVPASCVNDYIRKFNPIILRWDRRANKSLCEGRVALNFGEAKGAGFNRVLILPTAKHAKFLSGDESAFGKDDTDGSRNKLYVGITRGRYSVAFVHEGESVIEGTQLWNPVN
jgi:DNA helicase II / ATP-dependent DNA helicase PcrA